VLTDFYDRGERVLGRAVLAAKTALITQYPTNDYFYGPAVLYTLFGDPALRVKFGAGTAVEERPTPDAIRLTPGPTVQSVASGFLFDVQGRRVTAPKAGVYFVRAEGGMRKVVIAR
jgi:hypothetical protein